MSNTFCPLPFSHLAIRPNGKIYPCCAFDWEHTPEDLDLNHPDVFNHPFLKEIRELMKKGEKVQGCNRCYYNEEHTGGSVRTYFIREADKYELPKEPTDDISLVYVDLALSNACNNKCRMCNPELSTSWYSDAKALGIKISKGILDQREVLDNYDLTKLRFIKMIGGEPLMEQPKFISLLERCDRKKLSILLTTNTTLIPNEKLTSLLKECKNVRINLSIDATEKLNDFLRKGSMWSTVVENINWYLKNFQDIKVHAVASIYNINHLDKLLMFFKENFSKIGVEYVLIDGPDWMHPKHLPESVKHDLKITLGLWHRQFNMPFFKILIDQLNHPGDFRKFMKNDKSLSDLRNENWKDVNPELFELVKEFYE